MSEMVFAPTQAGADKWCLKDMRRECKKGHTDDWSCKKTASRGDLYLFYFGDPEYAVLAIGICDGEVVAAKNQGWDWTKSPHAWFCRFEPLFWLNEPVSKDDFQARPVLAKWWAKRPYRDRSKSVPENVVKPLLELIAAKNPRLRSPLAA